MTDNPDWVFYRDDKKTEAEIMPRLVEEFPGFRSRWEKHLELWKGERAGGYNDIAQFAHFMVEELYPSGQTEEVQRVFDLMEQWLVNGNTKVGDIVVIGFLEMFKLLRRGNPLAERHLFLSSGRSLATLGMRLKEYGPGKAA